MLIDSGLLSGFWTKAMETANYLQNRLPTRSRSHGEMIPEKAWTGWQQDLCHIRIFRSLALAIFQKKRELNLITKESGKESSLGTAPIHQRIFVFGSPDKTSNYRKQAVH